MSTRSLTITKDKEGEFHSLYKHWDGYPSNMVRLISDKISDYHYGGSVGELKDHFNYNFDDGSNRKPENYNKWKEGFQVNEWYNYIYVISPYRIKVCRPIDYPTDKPILFRMGGFSGNVEKFKNGEIEDYKTDINGLFLSDLVSNEERCKELRDKTYVELTEDEKTELVRLQNLTFHHIDGYYCNPKEENLFVLESWDLQRKRNEKDDSIECLDWKLTEREGEEEWIKKHQIDDTLHGNNTGGWDFIDREGIGFYETWLDENGEEQYGIVD